MTLRYIETDDPHWVPADDGEHVFQHLGFRVTYTSGSLEDGVITWNRSFDFYLDRPPFDQVNRFYMDSPEAFKSLFPDSPPLQATPAPPVNVHTALTNRLDVSRTDKTIDSSSITIDKVTV